MAKKNKKQDTTPKAKAAVINNDAKAQKKDEKPVAPGIVFITELINPFRS